MSSVSPVFYAIVRVRIGLKTQFYLGTRVVEGRNPDQSTGGPYSSDNGEQT